MRSWLLYIPADPIEIYPQMKYQLPTINRSWDSTLAKNLNLVFGWTVRKPESSMPSTNFSPQNASVTVLVESPHLHYPSIVFIYKSTKSHTYRNTKVRRGRTPNSSNTRSCQHSNYCLGTVRYITWKYTAVSYVMKFISWFDYNNIKVGDAEFQTAQILCQHSNYCLRTVWYATWKYFKRQELCFNFAFLQVQGQTKLTKINAEKGILWKQGKHNR